MRRWLRHPAAAVGAAALAGTLVAVVAVPGRHGSRRPRAVPTRAAVAKDLARLPVAFEPNVGQADRATRFLARQPGYDLLIGPTGARMVLSRAHPSRAGIARIPTAPARAATPSVLTFETLGSNPHATVSGAAPLPGRVNYFLGRSASGWHTGIATFGGVDVKHVYPGVDLGYSGGGGRIEYTFTISPDADPAAIRLGVRGANAVRLDAAGDLVVRTSAGTVVQHVPFAYQTISGRRRPVHVAFSLRGRAVGFTVSAYDHSAPLVVDPVLTYSTYLGGDGGDDQAYGVALDSSGDIVVSGLTSSASFPFAQSGTQDGSFDAFVIELDPSGASVVYSTYIGGDGDDEATGVALDSSGDAYVTGFTNSNDYPLQASLPNTNDNDGRIGTNFDAFVTELNSTGSSLVYSTLLGGSASDEGEAIAVGSDGAAYVTGLTASTNFPTTNGVSQRTASAWSAFVTKLEPAGTDPEQIAYSTYLGGNTASGAVVVTAERALTEGQGIAVDSSGNAYVGGLTLATNFPTTTGAYSTSMGSAATSGFVTKLNAAGSRAYSTFLGGTGGGDESQVDGLALAAGKIVVAGATTGSDFPTTSTAFRRTYGGGGSDAFVAELNPAASTSAQLVYSTFLGGSGADAAEGVAADSHGNVFVTGRTWSADFPTAHAFLASDGPPGSTNAFVAKLEPGVSGTAGLVWSSYLGGGGDTGLGIALNGSGGVFVVGETPSLSFPTVNPLVTAPAGAEVMGFLSEIVDTPTSHILLVNPTSGSAGDPVTITGAGFTGATAVKFNGVPAGAAGVGFTVNSDTQITATVPALATDGNVTVTTPGGVSNGVHFDVVPVITDGTGFEPTHGIAGQVVDVTGKSLVTPTALTLDGSTIPFSVVTPGTHLRFTLPVTAVSGVIAVTTANGVADTSTNTPSAFTVDPRITGFTPASAVGGASVQINGSGLAGATEVSFTTDGGWVDATPTSDTATAIVVPVPDSATVGPVRVTTPSPASPVESTASFKPLPKITSLSAYDGQATDSVAITGTNLLDATAVKFGTVTASVTPVSATEVDTTVPGGGFSSGKVSVTTPAGTALSTQTYAITKVTGFSPVTATAGTTVTITGQGLGSTSAVDFAGHAGVAPVGTPTATAVKVVVPDDAVTGALVLHTPNISAGGIATVASFKPLPKITSLSAVDGQTGNTVTITGTNLTDDLGVAFGTIHTSHGITLTPATSLTATVPPGFSSGKVSVQTPTGTAVSTQTYTITKVTGFTPPAAPAGATVTIIGQGLVSTNAVDFIGHAGVVPVSTTATSVKVVVPDDVEPGQLVVHTPNIDAGGIETVSSLKVVPTITSVTPADGMAGTPVTITGTNFFTSVSTVVKFGNVVQTLYTVISPTEIDTTIPAGFTSGTVSVTTPGGGTAVSTTTVAITKITGFSPSTGVAGTTVTITGQGLGSTSEVTFNGITFPGPPPLPLPAIATIVSVSPTAVKVTVPSTASVGKLTLYTPHIDISGIQTATDFTPVPTLAPLTPTKANGLLLVGGANLEPTGTAPTATLGSESLPVLIPSQGAFLTTVPADAITGTLTVTTPTGVVKGTLKVPPTVSGGPTPGEGAVGTQVQVSGLTFTGTTKVTFGGGASASFTLTGALGSTQTLTFKVPAAAVSGPITVTNAGGSTATAGSFVVDPAVTTITPASGPVGATLTLTGTGFTGANLVTFGGGVTAVPTSVTGTSLKVVVPQGVSAGSLVVSTAAGGVSAASPTQFTPTETLSSFAPLGGKVGTPVTITGAGFTSVTDVKFGSTSVGGFTVVSPTEITTTVPAGATAGTITVVRSAAPTSLVSAASFTVLSVTSLSATSVHEGDTLTITGTGLGHTTTVTFGGDVDATPSSVTATTVGVVVPGGVSDGTLTVTTSDFGTVTTPSVTILAPEISSFSVTNAHTGSTLQILGAGFVDVSAIEIGGANVTGDTTSVTAGEIDLTIPSGDGGDIAVTTDQGTTSGTFTLYDHASGLANDYWDDQPLGTFLASEAQAAALVWGGSGFTTVQCSGEDALQAYDGSNYGTWVYGAGPLQGYAVAAATPTCPTTSDTPWN